MRLIKNKTRFFIYKLYVNLFLFKYNNVFNSSCVLTNFQNNITSFSEMYRFLCKHLKIVDIVAELRAI